MLRGLLIDNPVAHRTRRCSEQDPPFSTAAPTSSYCSTNKTVSFLAFNSTFEQKLGISAVEAIPVIWHRPVGWTGVFAHTSLLHGLLTTLSSAAS
jgi:hypothetical protein